MVLNIIESGALRIIHRTYLAHYAALLIAKILL